MMTPQRILERHRRGYTTDTGLIIEVLYLTDRPAVVEALGILPRDVLKKLEDFVGCYTPQTAVFNGPPPNMETVQFVKEWFVAQAGNITQSSSSQGGREENFKGKTQQDSLRCGISNASQEHERSQATTEQDSHPLQ